MSGDGDYHVEAGPPGTWVLVVDGRTVATSPLRGSGALWIIAKEAARRDGTMALFHNIDGGIRYRFEGAPR